MCVCLVCALPYHSHKCTHNFLSISDTSEFIVVWWTKYTNKLFPEFCTFSIEYNFLIDEGRFSVFNIRFFCILISFRRSAIRSVQFSLWLITFSFHVFSFLVIEISFGSLNDKCVELLVELRTAFAWTGQDRRLCSHAERPCQRWMIWIWSINDLMWSLTSFLRSFPCQPFTTTAFTTWDANAVQTEQNGFSHPAVAMEDKKKIN